MKIIGQTTSFPVIEEVPVTRLFDNTKEADHRLDPVIVEHPFLIEVNGKPCCSLTCSPDHLVQLAVGHLFSQGYIDGTDWIDTIELTEEGKEAKVTLTADKTLLTPLSNLNHNHLRNVAPRPMDDTLKHLLFAQAKALYDSADWFFQTGAAHSSSLSVDGAILYRFSDVSRHNTIDKIIGQALMDEVDLARSVLFTSGRIPLDMLLKVARCGIPVVGSRSAPTTAALALAKNLGILLVGFVRQGRMNVY
jgi:FdhD protein